MSSLFSLAQLLIALLVTEQDFHNHKHEKKTSSKSLF